ncbi:hypothetical protein GCM10009718_36660 [Isoptericola halotolerans]|uniref:Uncharacterized protein n=1 Tax=Isoptericola halotolerans TaxID=300560 RepID=A0ABX2A5X1_9MICO|nr:hypothetical protein [Isoptericola halotolerans]NOV97310.1 hypothetical protein [Isoptericola halotolerans]
MCTTLVWAVNRAADTEGLRRFTHERLGVSPRPAGRRIVADQVRPGAVTFTVTPNLCDCRALIGLHDEPESPGEIGAGAWLGWLRDLPSAAPYLTRLAVLRAWSPDDTAALVPVATRSVAVDAVDEATLRTVRHDALLVVDYPCTPWSRR